jgi:hypothetical protein
MFGVKIVDVAADDDAPGNPAVEGSSAEVRVLVARREDQPGPCMQVAGRISVAVSRLKLAGLAVAAPLPVVTGVLSVGVVLGRCQEQWIDYSAAAEALTRERHLDQTRARASQGPGRDPAAGRQAEEMLTRESAAWADERAG